MFPTLFNKCLHLSCFPDSLKIRNIILFQKGGKDQRLPSYFTPTDNREGAGETYDSEADLSSGVHQQPERPTAWLQRRQVYGYSHQRATKQNSNSKKTLLISREPLTTCNIELYLRVWTPAPYQLT
ncbi:hypothetical protein AVEN_23289-1 [Araneus ventricosus]|uniref:Uncharacterized protein n=1 Tax=Araneus ventricosus TaxID=182803 RepID=A0A4Y2GH41_ARAVE|nr:hypothetical protein AVEN_23289-1 [Araneus ventricosus]